MAGLFFARHAPGGSEERMRRTGMQTSETFLLNAILSLSGGFQDAYTYNLRDKVFANAQTGNVVLMSQHFLMKDWEAGAHYLLPVLAFACGILAAEQVGHRYRSCERVHWRQIVLLIEILVLTAVGLIPARYDTAATMLVSLSCAMQVQAFRKVRGYGYASTMCIGNLRSGTESLSVYLRERNLWDAECAMIPDGGDKVLMSDARQFALRAERHGDVPSESFRLIQFVLHATLAEVQLTGPCTVQALPVGTLKLWTRILTARLRRLSLRSSEKQCHEGDKD